MCCECKDSLIDLSKRVFFCPTCSSSIKDGDILYWCKDCYKKTEHDHVREKLKGGVANPFSGENEKIKDQDKKQYLDNLFDEYHNLDFEDVIGGGQVKTRFKYTGVKPDDYGLNTEEILLLDDKQLNQLVTLKQYRPYKDADGDNPNQERKSKQDFYKMVNKKREFKKELNEKLDMVRKVEQASLEAEKAKLLKTGKKKDDKAERKKDKLLKKRKHKERDSKAEEGEDAKGQVDPEEWNKRKRMELYTRK